MLCTYGWHINELFFPKADPATGALLTAFSFCSLYLLRPLGAVIFVYIDKFGCIDNELLWPRYNETLDLTRDKLVTPYSRIGITATIIITICRMLQVSSMGEVVASEIYLTEFIRKPFRYPAVSLLTISCLLGGIWRSLVSLWLMAILMARGFLFGAELQWWDLEPVAWRSGGFSNARNRIKAQLIEHRRFIIVFPKST